MTIVVALFLGLAGMVCVYTLGNGGPVASVVFFTILFIGVVIRLAKPAPDRPEP